MRLSSIFFQRRQIQWLFGRFLLTKSSIRVCQFDMVFKPPPSPFSAPNKTAPFSALRPAQNRAGPSQKPRRFPRRAKLKNHLKTSLKCLSLERFRHRFCHRFLLCFRHRFRHPPIGLISETPKEAQIATEARKHTAMPFSPLRIDMPTVTHLNRPLAARIVSANLDVFPEETNFMIYKDSVSAHLCVLFKGGEKQYPFYPGKLQELIDTGEVILVQYKGSSKYFLNTEELTADSLFKSDAILVIKAEDKAEEEQNPSETPQNPHSEAAQSAADLAAVAKQIQTGLDQLNEILANQKESVYNSKPAHCNGPHNGRIIPFFDVLIDQEFVTIMDEKEWVKTSARTARAVRGLGLATLGDEIKCRVGRLSHR